MNQMDRTDKLKSLLKQRILVIDGAMGTAIQERDLGPDDFGGPEYEGCNEYLVLTRPDVIGEIHQGYLDAGADIVETDTFGATSIVLSEYNLAHEARRINEEGARLARGLADAASTPGKPRFVAGSMGRQPRVSLSPVASLSTTWLRRTRSKPWVSSRVG